MLDMVRRGRRLRMAGISGIALLGLTSLAQADSKDAAS